MSWRFQGLIATEEGDRLLVIIGESESFMEWLATTVYNRQKSNFKIKVCQVGTLVH